MDISAEKLKQIRLPWLYAALVAEILLRPLTFKLQPSVENDRHSC